MEIVNRRAIASWVYIATTSISGMLILLVVAKYLSPRMAGVWFTLQSTAAFVLLAEFGLGYALMRELAYARAEGGLCPSYNKRHIRDILRFLTASLASAAIAAVAIWVYFQSAPQERDLGSTSPALAAMWLLYCPTVFLNLMAIPIRSMLEGSGLLHLEKTSAIVSHVTQTLLLVAAAAYFQSLSIMCLSTAIAALLNLVLMLALSYWNRGRIVASGTTDFSIRRLVRASANFFSINLGAALSKYAFAPVVAISVGASELAPIFFGIKIFAAAANTVAVLITSERARLATMFAAGRGDDAGLLYIRIMRRTIAASTVIGVVMMVAFPAIVKMFPNKTYQLDWWILALLLFDFMLNNCAAVSANFVNACNKNPFKLTVISSGVLCVVCLLVLAPRIGASAAVVAQLVGGLLTSYWYNNFQALKVLRELRYG